MHGGNGIGDVHLPRAAGEPTGRSGAEAIVEAARAHPGELHLLAIGPFTNLSLALDLEPRLPELLGHVTVMGGAAMAPGNVSALAEANVANDPLAAHRVFTAGFDLTMVGLDVTMRHVFEESHRQELLAVGTPGAVAIAQMLEFYFAFYAQRFGRPCAVLHDPLAAAVATGDVTPRSPRASRSSSTTPTARAGARRSPTCATSTRVSRTPTPAGRACCWRSRRLRR